MYVYIETGQKSGDDVRRRLVVAAGDYNYTVLFGGREEERRRRTNIRTDTVSRCVCVC